MMADNCKTDFRVYGDNRGIFYGETNRCLIYLSNHETLSDLMSTIQHEVVHHCLDKLGENEAMDEDQEEKCIFFMAWADEAL